ncbi:aldo/keto reductase [Zoogloea sp.]|uniref:aldo/keto reductase n=1 Tax=Zoogloea sp. TaxID=49181 RepID=UPI0035B0A410
MSHLLAPTLKLSNGVEIPQLGLGTWPMNDAESAPVVAAALEMGYRHIDTAENYQNETGVGQGVRASGVPREQVFVTTKFNRQWHSIAGVQQACEASLRRLGLDYIDLLLVHWPNPEQGRYVEAFEGLLQVQARGLVRAVGTSNFKPAHLAQLFERGLCPQVNQIQLDPYHARPDLVDIHQAKGIVTETWGPVGRGSQMLADPAICAVAERVGRTPAQVVLRWHTQQGFLPIPKSSNPQRLAENLACFDFELSDAEIRRLAALSRPDPNAPDADVFGH